jgi:hypothetical protein
MQSQLFSDLVHIHTQCPEILLGELDLGHQLLVSLGNIVEGENAPAETEEEKSAKGDESPERELSEGLNSLEATQRHHAAFGYEKTYDGNNVLLYDLWERHQTQEEGQVEL